MLLLASPAWSTPLYTIVDLGVLGGVFDSSVAYGVNNQGQVVGESYSSARGGETGHAFLYSAGTMTDLGTLGRASVATAINDSGVVTGSSERTDGTIHAFRYSGGAMLDLGTLGGDLSQAWGINNAGEIVGVSKLPSSSLEAFRYAGGVMSDLGFSGVARGINAAGQIVGYLLGVPSDAFLYSSGSTFDLGTLGGAVSAAFSINSSGAIAGQSSTTGSSASDQGFILQASAMTGIPGTTAAWDINDAGDAVGSPAFLLSNGTVTNLDDLLPPGSGWADLVTASGINNAGQIVGSGTINGVRHAFLMSPVSAVAEPQTLMLFLLGLALLLLARPDPRRALRA